MKETVFQYKCRLCGEIDENPRSGEETAAAVLIAVVGGFDLPKNFILGPTPRLIKIHHCKRPGRKCIGVADLIGIETKED